MSKARITDIRPADDQNQVVTVVGDEGGYRRTPCVGCPWRKDQTGSFPAEAFRHSANTAYDMSDRGFGCHESGTAKPVLCAGFLLRGAEHNLRIRLRQMGGEGFLDLTDGGHDLHGDYVEMAIANGVPEDDPALRSCRRGSFAFPQEKPWR